MADDHHQVSTTRAVGWWSIPESSGSTRVGTHIRKESVWDHTPHLSASIPAETTDRVHRSREANVKSGLRWIPGGAHERSTERALPDYW